MSIVPILRNADVGLLSIPMVLPGIIVSGFEVIERSDNFVGRSVAFPASMFFRVLTVITALPLLIYTLAKSMFILLARILTNDSVSCIKDLSEYSMDQLYRVLKGISLAAMEGMSNNCANVIIQHREKN